MRSEPKEINKVVTITGIRPDFIRMKNIFTKLDNNFEHIMIHTGQHYDDALNGIFFRDLNIRKPDFVLESGKNCSNQYEQLSYLSTEVIKLFKEQNIDPDIVLFLGDSNSVLASVPLFKEGYKIGHIEGGMRSYDRRMPEEVNRVMCDYVSDIVFVYTDLYKDRLALELKPREQIHVVGNTITEIVNEYRPVENRTQDFILADIHRNEALSDINTYNHILEYLNRLGAYYKTPVWLVRFPRAEKLIERHSLLYGRPNVQLVGPYGFLSYISLQYHAKFIVSDSGTAQEEAPLLGTPVIVPRNRTERPESLYGRCSIMLGEDAPIEDMLKNTKQFIKFYDREKIDLSWLGDGTTSDRIINILKGEKI